MSTLGERAAGLGSTLSVRAVEAVVCWAFLMLVPSASHTCSPRDSCTVNTCRRREGEGERERGGGREGEKEREGQESIEAEPSHRPLGHPLRKPPAVLEANL